MLKSLGYSIRQGFRQIFRNRTMSIASCFSITAMLLILGIFFILLINVNMVAETVKGDYDTIEVFMLDKTEKEDTLAIMDELQTVDGVSSVTYRTKKEALEILRDRWGDQSYLLDNLAENPLPNSIVIKITDLSKAEKVADRAKSYDGIEKVNYYKDTVDNIMKVTNFIQYAALIIMAFLIIVSIVVVSNTVKLTVHARGDEISIMKYVGATNWFIRGPFLFEGMFIGIISAAVSVGVIAILYARLVDMIGEDILVMLSTPMVDESFLVKNLIIIFVALGVSIGTCGSIISMGRFLDV